MAGPETPKLMVDVVIPSEKGVVLIRRSGDPFEGRWALHGGFVGVYSEPGAPIKPSGPTTIRRGAGP